MEGLSVHFISSINIEINFKSKIPVSQGIQSSLNIPVSLVTKGFSTLFPSFRTKILDGIKI